MTYARIQHHRCTECNHNARIVVSERRSSFQISNPTGKLVCKTKIDGCYLQGQKSCDYLIVDCSDKKAYFVELKGSHVLHAFDQIQRTMSHLRRDLVGYCCFARVVPTKVPVPNIQNNSRTLALRRAFRALGGDLIIKAIALEETI